MEALVKVETLLLVLCTSWGLTGALQLELASVVSVTVYSLGLRQETQNSIRSSPRKDC